ncbi:hypothetical protein Phum_PHUM581010 [Pediculus humanus corporis]|uniref:Uncharacterized protein n=1 Tax=Pediculus humanus subsp. corporis TaxID=121224 RepID=E0W208_PEDHC|nr:uncharacterized protein Phum_PHUM581010 [Pediculus humanus corporis]EEB19602.1 hypothetical protein Phum_PHUM581010 [Pediculus humanus corporis]
MKPLSFENLRRFVTGGKKKKDRNESSFKRSDSFKRISIKKNYLERGKKHRQQAVEAAVVAAAACANVEATTVKVTKAPINATSSVTKATSGSHIARARGGGGGGGGNGGNCRSSSPGNDRIRTSLVKPATSTEGPDSLVIDYNQWLKGMKTDDCTSKNFSFGKSSPTEEEKPPTPPPRKKTGSLSGTVHSTLEILKLEQSPVPVEKKYHSKSRQPSPTVNKSIDSLISLSPQVSRSSLSPGPSRTDSGLSINLGRVWIDAPLAMAPRSLELPRPAAPPSGMSKEPARIHHSLDSALKESGKTSRRHHHYQSSPMTSPSYYISNLSAVSRTLSSSTTHTNKSRDSSGKDSGFSFSISIPRLTDFTGISANTSGFFRKKKKLTRPKPSVSRDGYFKRTSGATRLVENKLNSVKRSNSKKKRAKRDKGMLRANAMMSKSDEFTVTAYKSSKSLKSLKLEPMIFVTPEKRKPGGCQKKCEFKEIRDCRVFDDLENDMAERRCKNVTKNVEGMTTNERVAGEKAEKNEGNDDDEEEQLYECIIENDCRQPVKEDEVIENKDTDDSDINYTDTDEERGTTFIPLGVSPVPRRKPVRKKKSTKRNVKYVAKPGIHRAQSTLRKSRRSKKGGIDFSLGNPW